ncbi:peptidyl-prolyl cis-trans isomerase [Patulibacter sp. SYSU D01012]|uniref:peptidyl-prolyl cis-trans isomerase n=1 Tax=Patulibacter sp. SYSU D01012 TaxID=2817381 RepID=UPI001B310C7B|nr:peptidyl-prolyl cis-trans isomerase [Patulibacter sp. SYSU D01012]
MSRHTRPLKTALVACAIGVPAAAALAGCGGGLSADAVAKVDGTEITKAAYDKAEKFILVQASQQATQGSLFKEAQPKLISFKPPYTDCTAAVKKSVPKAQQKQATPAALKQVCESYAQQIKPGAVGSLLQQQIVKEEAEKEKISVSDKDVDKQYQQALTQYIGGKQNLAKFKQVSGLGEDVLRDQVRTQLLVQKLQEKVTKDASKVSDADVKAFYEKNKSTYTQPETREGHIVLTKTEAQAEKAKKAVEDGQSFASVAKRYSIDSTTKKNGGKLTFQKGQQEAALEKAAFAAKKGDVAGPIKTESGYYVVQIDKITPSKTVPFDQVKAVLKQQLQQTKPQEAWSKWGERITKEWKAKTECRDGYNDVELCGNQPKKDTTAAQPAAQ